MDIQIHSLGFDAKQELLDFVNTKTNKLVKFSDDIINIEVFLRLVNSSTDDTKMAEMKVEVPGHELFAKKQGKSFEESVDNVVEALKKQLQKHKEKLKGN